MGVKAEEKKSCQENKSYKVPFINVAKVTLELTVLLVVTPQASQNSLNLLLCGLLMGLYHFLHLIDDTHTKQRVFTVTDITANFSIYAVCVLLLGALAVWWQVSYLSWHCSRSFLRWCSALPDNLLFWRRWFCMEGTSPKNHNHRIELNSHSVCIHYVTALYR